MKPLNLLILVAALCVGGLLLIMMNSDSGREGRSDSSRDTDSGMTAQEDGADDATEDKDAEGEKRGDLSFTMKIVAPDGAAAGGAEIILRHPRGDETATHAGDDGVLDLKGLAAGFYLLAARSGKAVGARNFLLEHSGDLGELRLTDGITVSGRVLDARGKPIVGATVEAVTATGASLSIDPSKLFQRLGNPDDVIAFAKAGDDGNYELTLPGANQYMFRAFSPRHGQETEPARPIVKDLTGLDFHLFGAAIVSGVVVDPGDNPVPGARVMLANAMTMFRGGTKIESVTDANGAFSLPATATSGRGNMILVARAVGFAAHVKSDISVPATNVRIKLEPGVTLRMRTILKDTEKPAEGVRVAVIYGGGFGTGSSNAAGEVVIEHLPTKSGGMGQQKSAFLTADRFVPQIKQLAAIEIKEGVIDVGDVEVEPGGVVRGLVKNRETQKPVTGAIVRAMGGLDRELMFLGGNTVLSNEKGEYELFGVPLKASSVAALHKDFVPELNINMMAMFGRNQGGASSMFPSGTNEITKEVLLTPGATVNGIVVDIKGDPVAGAQVTQLPDGGGMGMGMIRMMMLGGPPKTHSNADGTFSLGPFARDKAISLAVSHRDYGPAEPTKTTPGSGAELRISLSEPLNVTGKVLDEQGEPIQGVRVTIDREEQKGNNPMRRQMEQMMGSGGTKPGVTDINGIFTVRNAPIGQVEVSYAHNGYMEKSESIALAPGKAEEKLPEVTLERGLGISGIVVDGDGQPLEGIQFNAWSQDAGAAQGQGGGAGGSRGRTYFNGRSDANGRFEQYGLADGNYDINVYAEGMYGETVKARTGQTEVRIVVLKGGTMRGRVLAGGTRVAGANVRATFADTPGRWMRGGNAQTDADGGFELTGLPQKPFTLRITHSDYVELTVKNVEAGAGVREFRLNAGRVITGRVVNSGRAPVEGALVMVTTPNTPRQIASPMGRSGTRSATSGADGTFRIAGIASEGELTVSIEESGKGFIKTSVKVAPGQHTVQLIATVGETISGTVYLADGQPAGFVTVTATTADGKSSGHTFIQGNDGKFEIKGLEKGVYKLQAHRWNQGKSTKAEAGEVRSGSTDVAVRFPE
ncbi:MAG: carboxypeptidase regulatory-like domain-containing protein [Planctomycetota bacterium]